MLAESSGKQNPDIAEQTARVCLVFPAGGEDMSMAVRLAAQGVSARSDNAWNLLAQGMADYRTGQYADAVKRLGQSIQKSRSYGGYPRLDAVAHLFLAMAHHAQGRRSEAKEHLDSGRQVVLTEARQIRKRGFGEYWWDWMFPFVVYPQAVSLIEGTPESKVRAQLNVEIETGGPTASAQKLIDEKKLQEACALLTSALAKLPEDRDLLQLRGEVALRLGRWKDAECDLMKLIDRSGDKHWRRFQVASVCLLAGNEDAYRRLCREMLGESRARQEIAESTAKACLILPVGGDDLPTATRLAKGAITADPKFIWNILAQGMADCRNGQHGAAVEGLNQAIERNAPQRIHSLDAIAHLFLAMAYHAQHQQDEAKKHLDAGRQLVLEEARGIRNRGFRDSWWDWTTAFFVYPQAVSLVEGAPESKVRAQINAEIEAGGQ
jgi:tetratricopeptide (TPR) repeat protein